MAEPGNGGPGYISMFVPDPLLDILLRGAILAAIALIWAALLIRANGLRSLSKMTNFDFVMTIAIGSLLASASAATQWSGFAQPLVAVAAMFVVQRLAARLRKSSDKAEQAMQNEPILLMRDGEFCEAAMQRARVAQSDIVAKLREANVRALGDVRAVVLETTGDVSVLHGESLDETLLRGVREVGES